MENEVKVSVIIPTYNREAFIEEAITSVLNQEYTNYELLVVDDNSQDNTIFKVTQLMGRNKDKIRLYINENQKGVSGTRNTGIQHATGKYLAFLDSDDIWMPNKLKLCMEIFENYSDVNVVLTNSFFFGEVEGGHGESSYKKSLFLDKYWVKLSEDIYLSKTTLFYYLLKFGSPFRVQALVIEADCVKKLGGFEEHMNYYEDSVFILKHLLKYKMIFVDRNLTGIRRHVDNTDNQLILREKVFGDFNLVKEICLINKKFNLEAQEEFLASELARAYIRLASYNFNSLDFDAAKKNLQESITLRYSNKALIRLFVLKIIPGFILAAILKLKYPRG